MAKKKPKTELTPTNPQIDENQLFKRISQIIEKRKFRAYSSANKEATLMFWEVGQHINSVILDSKRAEYGKKILPTLAAKLGWSLFIRCNYCITMSINRQHNIIDMHIPVIKNKYFKTIP